MNEQTLDKRRGRILLAAGAFAGLAAALFSILSVPDSTEELPPGVVARVNGADISEAELTRVLEAIDTSTRDPLTPADRELALERLIDEELLVQRGLETGLADSDRRVRQAIVSSMIEAAIADARAAKPEEEALRAFYDEHIALFSAPARLDVRRVFVARGDDPVAARTRAERAAEALRNGEPFEAVAERLGNPPPVPVAAGPVSVAILRRTLGPGLTDRAAEMKPGAVSAPVETQTGFHVLMLVDAEIAEPKPFEEIHETVGDEYRSRARDRALVELLEFLRKQGEVIVNKSDNSK